MARTGHVSYEFFSRSRYGDFFTSLGLNWQTLWNDSGFWTALWTVWVT